jgi:hypothetical protein
MPLRNERVELSKKTFGALLCACLFALSGCASITSGNMQSVLLETRTNVAPVAGARCELTNDKGSWSVVTPASMTIQSSYGDLSVRCNSDTHEPVAIVLKSTAKAATYGNIILAA